MNGGRPSGALYSHRTVYICHERGRAISLEATLYIGMNAWQAKSPV
ncbi:hypothetical protein GBAR_LOCUS24054 [Geodia barretti]|uniref:Uncharacterized protein n=1 Tax=Geodia barretti TaxID=519541 RepID=A0AA35T8S4_GEOBA|nr:hypothetical protein GBAR_LOCUS24054 [Geodia barretti]